MKAKSGSAVTAVEPTDPEKALEADEAEIGKVAEAKAKQLQNKEGKYGATKAPAFKPAAPDASNSSDEDKEVEKTSWIEIELLDEEDKPVSGEKYEIELPDGSLTTGTLDKDGYAKVEGFEAGDCQVSFPKLDKSAWEKV
jgi:type VI secretion system secreted protein VgrG